MSQSSEHPTESDEWSATRKSTTKRRSFTLEYRMKEDKWEEMVKRDDGLRFLYPKVNHWRVFKRYRTESGRHQALETLTTKQDYWSKYYEFRKV